MKPRLDLKSLIVGLAVGLLMACLVGATLPHEQQAGRFEICTSESHAFVIDTATGQVWEKYQSPSGGSNDPDFSATKLKNAPGQ